MVKEVRTMENDLSKKILEISESLTDDVIEKATNEELMGYLFLVEKMKSKLEEACEIDKGE
jgi:hypothetical protein